MTIGAGSDDIYAQLERELEKPQWAGYGEKLPHRDFIRQNCRTPREGLVVEDLDLVLRLYGGQNGTDSIGRIRLTEMKYLNATLDVAQRKTFGIVDVALRECERTRERYDGFWLLQPQGNPQLLWHLDDTLIILSQWEARHGMMLQQVGVPMVLTLEGFSEWVDT